ncbi:MAG: amidohydrolase, partial [Gammaproteobacteria bacterium]|nr:amidohydrolase [Gammaproteobacteria bacterium]
MADNVDLLVLHAHLLTMAGDGVGYVADGAVAIRGEVIVDVGPSSQVAPRYRAAETLDAGGCA